MFLFVQLAKRFAQNSRGLVDNGRRRVSGPFCPRPFAKLAVSIAGVEKGSNYAIQTPSSRADPEKKTYFRSL